jgi:hypothetical protein
MKEYETISALDEFVFEKEEVVLEQASFSYARVMKLLESKKKSHCISSKSCPNLLTTPSIIVELTCY